MITVIGGSGGAGGGGGNVPQIAFLINDGTIGTNVAPILRVPDYRSVTKCVVTVKNSDSVVDLEFDILQNLVSVFSTRPTIPAGTAGFTESFFTTLTSSPLPIAPNDQFIISIINGSAGWLFTTTLE